jgi:hypothetical protein
MKDESWGLLIFISGLIIGYFMALNHAGAECAYKAGKNVRQQLGFKDATEEPHDRQPH